jgi:predicted GIY-YIG superfamily endonuclease
MVSRQLVNQKLAKTLSAGSNENVTWSCDNVQHLTWDTQVKNRTRLLNPTGCPYCSGNLVVPDVTDLGTTHPTLAAGMRYPELAKTLSAGMSQQVLWKCPNGHPDWSAAVCDRTKAHRPTGCKLCANYGFDPSKPAWVYLLRSDDGRAFKVGLTTNWRRRRAEHKRQKFSTKIEARRFADGAIAQTFEKQLKAGIKQAGWKPARTAIDMPSGGFTETFNKRDSGDLSCFEDLWDALLLRRILAVL